MVAFLESVQAESGNLCNHGCCRGIATRPRPGPRRSSWSRSRVGSAVGRRGTRFYTGCSPGPVIACRTVAAFYDDAFGRALDQRAHYCPAVLRTLGGGLQALSHEGPQVLPRGTSPFSRFGDNPARAPDATGPCSPGAIAKPADLIRNSSRLGYSDRAGLPRRLTLLLHDLAIALPGALFVRT